MPGIHYERQHSSYMEIRDHGKEGLSHGFSPEVILVSIVAREAKPEAHKTPNEYTMNRAHA